MGWYEWLSSETPTPTREPAPRPSWWATMTAQLAGRSLDRAVEMDRPGVEQDTTEQDTATDTETAPSEVVGESREELQADATEAELVEEEVSAATTPEVPVLGAEQEAAEAEPVVAPVPELRIELEPEIPESAVPEPEPAAPQAAVETAVVEPPAPVPSDVARWVEEQDVTVVDGKAVLYKAVDDGWESEHGAYYKPGTTVECSDFRDNNKPANGLHFSPTPEIAHDYADYAARAVEVHVNLDTISIIDGTKVKAPEAECVREVDLGWVPAAPEEELETAAPEVEVVEPELDTPASTPAPELASPEATSVTRGQDRPVVAPDLHKDPAGFAAAWADELRSGDHKQVHGAWEATVPHFFSKDEKEECTLQVAVNTFDVTVQDIRNAYGSQFVGDILQRNDIECQSFDRIAKHIEKTAEVPARRRKEPELELG